VRTRSSELTLAVDRHQGRSGYCKEQIGGDGGARGRAQREEAELAAAWARSARTSRAQADEAACASKLRRRRTRARRGRRARAARGRPAPRPSRKRARGQVACSGTHRGLQNARESGLGTPSARRADLLKLAAELPS
jgi:hypothetical protein